MHSVEPLNNGHIGGRSLVLCREIAPISEFGNGKHNTAMAIMCINVRAIGGLAVLGGY